MGIEIRELQMQYPKGFEKMEHTYGGPERVKPVITLETLEEECYNDELLENLLDSFKQYLFRYVKTVLDWCELVGKDKSDPKIQQQSQQVETERSRTHDVYQDSILILARNMRKRGKFSDWYEKGHFESRAACAKLALDLIYLEWCKMKIEEGGLEHHD